MAQNGEVSNFQPSVNGFAFTNIVSTIGHNINIGEPTLHGLFRSAYSPKPPPT